MYLIDVSIYLSISIILFNRYKNEILRSSYHADFVYNIFNHVLNSNFAELTNPQYKRKMFQVDVHCTTYTYTLYVVYLVYYIILL